MSVIVAGCRARERVRSDITAVPLRFRCACNPDVTPDLDHVLRFTLNIYVKTVHAWFGCVLASPLLSGCSQCMPFVKRCY
jgi:hypothetical protein